MASLPIMSLYVESLPSVTNAIGPVTLLYMWFSQMLVNKVQSCFLFCWVLLRYDDGLG